MTERSWTLMAAFSASGRVGNTMFPRASRLSDRSWGSTTNEATLIPSSEPTGLKDWAMLSLLVEFSFVPRERMKGLAVVSRKASPKVRM